MASGDLAPVGESHPMRVEHGRPLFDELCAGSRQILAIGVGEPADLLVLGLDEGRPIEGRFANAPAEFGRVAEVVGEAARDHVELLRHAAADDARAANPALFRHQRLRAMTGGDARRSHATRPCADHEEIDVERHSFSLCAPEPETKRACLEIDALFLHRRAGALKDVGRQLFAPGSGDVAEILEEDRGDLNIFLACGTIKEGRDLGDVLLRHLRGKQALRLDVGLLSRSDRIRVEWLSKSRAANP